MVNAEQLFTAEGLGERWQRSKLSVLRDARQGKLPAVRIGARTVRFRLADVLAFEQARITPARKSK